MRTIYVNYDFVNQDNQIINAAAYLDFEGKLNRNMLKEIRETLMETKEAKDLIITFFHILEE